MKEIAGELAERRDALAQLQPLKETDQRIRESLAEMKRVWLDDPEAGSEKNCQKVLADNLWVLRPDYIVKAPPFSPYPNISLSNVFCKQFPDFCDDWNDDRWKAVARGRLFPDMCGPAEISSAIAPGKRARVYLVIELKAAHIILGHEELEQAHAYGFGFYCNGQRAFQAEGISGVDCLVIGGDASKVNDAHLRWGADPHDAIRVIPMSYAQLYARAERLAGLLSYDGSAQPLQAGREMVVASAPSGLLRKPPPP